MRAACTPCTHHCMHRTQVWQNDATYIAVLLEELSRLCAKGGEHLRRAPEVNTKAEWDELMMDVLQQGDKNGPYLSQDAAKITRALEDLATYCLAWVESADFAPPLPFDQMHEVYSPPLQEVIELCWQLRNSDNQDRPRRKRTTVKVVRRGKSRAFYAAHFGAEAGQEVEGAEEEGWSDDELSCDGGLDSASERGGSEGGSEAGSEYVESDAEEGGGEMHEEEGEQEPQGAEEESEEEESEEDEDEDEEEGGEEEAAARVGLSRQRRLDLSTLALAHLAMIGSRKVLYTSISLQPE